MRFVHQNFFFIYCDTNFVKLIKQSTYQNWYIRWDLAQQHIESPYLACDALYKSQQIIKEAIKDLISGYTISLCDQNNLDEPLLIKRKTLDYNEFSTIKTDEMLIKWLEPYQISLGSFQICHHQSPQIQKQLETLAFISQLLDENNSNPIQEIQRLIEETFTNPLLLIPH